MRPALPIASVLAAIVALWYLACMPLNAAWTRDQAARAGEAVSVPQVVAESFGQARPVLPAPHQVLTELWQTTVLQAALDRTRSLANARLAQARMDRALGGA